MAEQIKFGDKLFLKGETLIIDNGASDAIIMSKNGTLRIEGDLTVQGVTTTVLSETVNIQDNQILLNSNFTGPNPTEDAGIEIERGDETNSHFLWQEASSRWTTGAHGLHSGSTISATTFSGNLTGSVTGDITSTGISTFTSVDINGGNIDGTVIGATNPQAGTFTNLNATTINGAVTGTVSNISNHDTDDLAEGTNNLYYTQARVDARYAQLQADANFIETLDGQAGSYYLDYTNFTNTPTTIAGYGITDGLSDVDVISVAPTTGQTVIWNGATWAPGDSFSQADFDSAFTAKDTDDLSEGSTNLYYTDARVGSVFDTRLATKFTDDLAEGSTNLYHTTARARASISATGSLSYDSATGVISYTQGNTDTVAEGSTNLYFTDARALAATDGEIVKFANMFATEGDLPSASTYHGMFAHVHGTGKGYFAHGGNWIKLIDETSSTTTDLTEGTNLYYTDARADARAQLKIDSLVDSAPGTLDTLNELAAALGDDANFSTTITTSLAGKEPTITAGTTSQYWRGDKSFQTLDTLAVAENTNLYFTDTRARAAISATGSLSYNSSTGVISYTQGNTDTVAEGSTNLYYTDARAQAVSINNIVEDTTPQLGGNLDLNTYDLSTTDPTVSLTTTTTAITTQGTVGASTESNLSNATVTVNDDGDYANAVSSYVTLTSTEIDNLGFKGESSLTYFGSAATTSNFVFRDASDNFEQNNMVTTYSPPTDTYTFTLPTDASTPVNSADADINFKQYAYGEMTVTSSTVLSGSTIQLRDASGFYIDKEHVEVSSLGGTSYKIIFWSHEVSAGDVIDVIAASAQTAIFEWGTSSYSETGLVATAESFSLQSSTNDIFAMGDLEITTGTTTGEVVGTLIYDSPTNNTIISGLTTVTIDGTGYQSALTVTEVPIIMTGNADTSNELSIAVGSATDARLWLLDSSGDLIYKFPAADGSANQVMKTDGLGDISWETQNTDDVTEGSTNLYYTTARDTAQFNIDLATKSTTDLAEGTNLYYTTARDTAQFNTDLATKSTTDLAEGTNLYYTDARADTRAQLKIDALVDSAPGTLDTLNELASALGDDANFSTTITNSIATKLPIADFNSTFDTSLSTKTTSDLAEGTNLYYTDARAQAVSINNIVEDTTPQLGGTLDLNTFDLTTLDDTVTLTTNATPSIVSGTIGASSEINLSNTTVTVNDDGDYANAVSSYVSLTSTQIDNLGFKGDISLAYFGDATTTSNFIFRDASDSYEQNNIITVYAPPTDTYTFTLATHPSTPINSADADISFKQYAYGEMTVSSSTVLTNANIKLRDANGFYIDKTHVDVTNTSGTNYKIVFWTHEVSPGDVIEVVNPSSSTAIFEWGAKTYNETGLVASSESFSISSSSNDIIAIGDLDFTSGNITGEVVGTLVYDKPSSKSIVSGLTTVSIDGTDYQSALTVSDVPVILSGNAGTSNEVSLAVGTGADGRIHQLDSSGNTIFKFPATDGSANQIMKTDGSGDISWTTQNETSDTDDVTEGSTNLYYTDARARSSISASGDLSYNSTTGVISFSATASPVTSVNTQTGAIVLDTDDVAEGTTNLYYTDARARAVSIENIVEDTTPQLGGNLDLNTYDLTTTDPTVTLTTTTTPVTTQGTIGASSESNLSNATVTVNDDGDYANAVSSYVTLTSTQIDTLGFKGDISLTYFGEASSSSNFVFRDTGDSIDQNQMITTYAPPTDTYTFTLSAQHADTDSGTPGNQNPLNISSADTDIKFKQSAYGEMTVTSSTVLSGSTIQLRDADGFYIDKEHVEVTSLGGTSYKIVFWTHEVSSGDVIDIIASSAQTAIFEWGTSTFSETGLVATAESFSVSSSTNDIFAMGDLNFTTGSTTGEVVGTLVYDSPTNNTIISGLSSVSIDGTTYQSAITNTQVPIVMTGNSGTSNELSLTVGSGTDARLWLLDGSANLIYKLPGTDGSANQVIKTDGSGDLSWSDITDTVYSTFNTDFDTRLATKSTTDLSEGTNLYYTDARADARAQLKIDALVGGASSAFDTLLEIENAMATDTELTNAISALNHDSLSGFVANEHIDWTSASAGTIHASNYTNTGDTTYTAGSGLSLVGTEFSNSAPDQTVSLTGAGATTVSGTYPNFTITSTDTNTTTDITGTIIPATDNTYDLGSTSKKYANIYGHTVEATYADLAERYASDAIYEAGTVVVFGGEAEITTTQLAGDVSVAGVISTNPALKLNAEAGNSQTHPYVALRGRVPCQIIGPVSKGDLIITAHDEPGYAKSNGKFDAGRSVFAKSIETDLSEGKKVIEVVIL